MAVQLDEKQTDLILSIDTALDALFGTGAEHPPATNILPSLAGYLQSANINGQDLRFTVRQAILLFLTGMTTASTPWSPATLVNSWVNFGGGYNNAEFYKDALGIVHLRGTIKDGTGGTVILTLPVGCRPDGQYIMTATASQGGNYTLCRVDVAINGDVVVQFPTSGVMDFVSLDQIVFKAV